MLKDWDYYKSQHLEKEITATRRWHETIEDMIKSPIERIAYMYLVFLANDLFEPMELRISEQVKIGNYRVDFLVSHRGTDSWIVVECDGHEWHEKTKKQAAHDKKRDRELIKMGYVVLRYTGSQICSNPMEIYEDVGQLVRDKMRKQRRDQEGV